VGTVSGNTLLTVTAATLSSISVTPVNPSIAKGTSVQFGASGTYSDGSTQDLTTSANWTSSNNGAATVGTNTGLAQSVNTGSTTITATVGTVSGTSTLTVTAATLVSIAVTPTTPTIANGTSQQFLATGTYTDSSTQNLTGQVTWGSSSAGVAVIIQSGPNRGLASATGVGTSTISASFGSVSGSTLLTVSAATLDSISIVPDNGSIANGTKRQFTATGHYSDGSTQNLTTAVTWDSDTLGTATISNAAGHEGEATSVAAGTTTISATLGTVSASTSLTVTNATLSSITLLPLNRNASIGAKVQYSATGRFSDTSTQDLSTQVTWSSSNTGVAIISNATSPPKGEVTAVGNGTTTITAQMGAVSGSTSLNVAP